MLRVKFKYRRSFLRPVLPDVQVHLSRPEKRRFENEIVLKGGVISQQGSHCRFVVPHSQKQRISTCNASEWSQNVDIFKN